jgi:hypothetical protein
MNKLPRLISYISGGRRGMMRWTRGWSSPVHYSSNGHAYVYWRTIVGRYLNEDQFVEVS